MIPRFTEFYLPVLKVLSDVEPKDVNALIDAVADLVNISEEDRQITTSGGQHHRYRSNISWAVTDLSQGAFIERVSRGTYVITMAGLEFLESAPEHPTRENLAEHSEQFRDFLQRQGTRSKKKASQSSGDGNTAISSSRTDKAQASPEPANNPAPASRSKNSVTLDELYQTLAICKKAGLSTSEIIAKIKQIEQEEHKEVIMSYLPKIASRLSQLAEALDVNTPIVVTFRKGVSAELTCGDLNIVFKISSDSQSEAKDKDAHKPVKSQKAESRSSSQTTLSPKTESKSTKKPVSSTASSVAREEQRIASTGMWIKDYSDRSIAVLGDTAPFTELLKSHGGHFCDYLSEGPGWIFFKNKEAGLRKDLKDYLRKPPLYVKKKSEPVPYHLLTPKLARYKEQIRTMKTFQFLNMSGPHKPAMLLAIFQLIKSRAIYGPKVFFTIELEGRYNALWQQLTGTPVDLGAAYAYAHISRDKFIQPMFKKHVYNYDITWNKPAVNSYFEYLVLDKALFDLLTDSRANEELSRFIIDTYFSSSAQKTSSVKSTQQPKMTLSIFSYEELFKNYLLSGQANKGVSYSASSVNLYIGVLKGQIVTTEVEKVQPGGNIFLMDDIQFLKNELMPKVEDAISRREVQPTLRAALKLYIQYLEQA